MKSSLLQEKNPRAFLLAFDKGDEVMATLATFARDHRIRAAAFQGIGALEKATFAYWNRESREYENIDVTDQVEVVALTGNIALSEDQPRIHAHIALGFRDGTLKGGHLVSGHVFPTLELQLNVYDAALHRSRDDETGLPLLVLK